MRGGGVAADPFGEVDRIGGGSPVEEFLDAAVDEPQPDLQAQNGFADDGEPEVAGFDQAGVHGADRDLVHPGAVDGEEREAASRRELRCRPGVGAHRMPVFGPVRVPDQSARPGMADQLDAVQVHHFPFEAARRERQIRQRR